MSGDARTAEALRVIQRTTNKQGNVTMLRLAENIANDAALVRLSQAEGWDAAVQEAEDCGLLNDAFADEIRGRNPYREPCRTCEHPEGYDRLSGPCPDCRGTRVLPPGADQ